MWGASPKRWGELIDVESVCEQGLVTKSFGEQGLAMQGLLLQDLITERFVEQGFVMPGLVLQGHPVGENFNKQGLVMACFAQ